MNVNGVTQFGDSYGVRSDAYVSERETVSVESEVKAASGFEEEACVYEPSLEIPTSTYKANDKLISKLKQDAEDRASQLQNIVSQLISKQANSFGTATDMWNFLREGNYTVDAETKAQAQADIAEDGYFGVEATSSRIIDFATALTGGDPSKIESMREAFKKGYEEAEKTWGGQLPEICQKTFDAVMEKFDKLAEENGLISE